MFTQKVFDIIFQMNYTVIIMDIMLIIVLQINKYLEKQIRVLFTFLAAFMFVLVTADTIDYLQRLDGGGRTLFGYIPILTAVYFIIYMLTRAYRKYKEGNKSTVAVILVLCTFAVLVVIGNIITKNNFGINVSIIFCIYAYYIYLHIRAYMRDPLTGFYGRKYFYTHTNNLDEENYYIVSMDINDLKPINDKFGHLEGDKCIKTIVDVIQKCSPQNVSLFRMGGDEFCAVCTGWNVENIMNYVASVREELVPYNYSLSLGWAPHHPGELVEKIYKEADAMMYAEKRRYKKIVKNQA